MGVGQTVLSYKSATYFALFVLPHKMQRMTVAKCSHHGTPHHLSDQTLAPLAVWLNVSIRFSLRGGFNAAHGH
jgi:hypothetical protein